MIYFAHHDEAAELTSSSSNIKTIIAVGLIVVSVMLVLVAIGKSSSSKSDREPK
jgi:multisubunit Na+/H+ antiporter MnhC subunit